MLTLQKLDLQGVGLVNLAGIKQLFPYLVYLDVSNNKIFSFEIIEQLRHLEEFADINLKNNPICIHRHLKDEIVKYLPHIERVNGEEIRVSGWKYKQET